MKGFIKKTMAGLCLGTGFVSFSGCHLYREWVDPCWPERYNYQARQSVRDAFGAQTHNGHVLDQTIWSHWFENEMDEKNFKTPTMVPTDKLTVAGMEHLKYIVRRRPTPDSKVYLQTVQDLPSNITTDKAAQYRTELDSRRVAAIRNHLNVLMVSRTHPIDFEVIVHDPATPSMNSLPITGTRTPAVNGALPNLYQQFTGTVPVTTGTGGSTGGGGGSSGGGSSSGGR